MCHCWLAGGLLEHLAHHLQRPTHSLTDANKPERVRRGGLGGCEAPGHTAQCSTAASPAPWACRPASSPGCKPGQPASSPGCKPGQPAVGVPPGAACLVQPHSQKPPLPESFKQAYLVHAPACRPTCSLPSRLRQHQPSAKPTYSGSHLPFARPSCRETTLSSNPRLQ